MKVSTTSNDPHMRAASLPYTGVAIKVSRLARDGSTEQRNQELEFVALLVRALQPHIGLKKLNDTLRGVVEKNRQPKLMAR